MYPYPVNSDMMIDSSTSFTSHQQPGSSELVTPLLSILSRVAFHCTNTQARVPTRLVYGYYFRRIMMRMQIAAYIGHFNSKASASETSSTPERQCLSVYSSNRMVSPSCPGTHLRYWNGGFDERVARRAPVELESSSVPETYTRRVWMK